MITLKVRIPAPSSMLAANLLGVLCLLGLAVAVGGITHNFWWSLLAASLEGLAFAVVWTFRIDAEGEEGSSNVPAITRAA